MSKRKGLSLEEKRTRMVEILTEAMEPFTLKELEKVAPKKKGITSMSVKDVVQSLVDDDLISTDKCGTQTVFWCFPSALVQQKRGRLSTLADKIKQTDEAIEVAKTRTERLRAERKGTDDRARVLEELTSLEAQYRELEAKVALVSSCDPATIRKMREDAQTCKDAANMWTDNIFSIKSFVVDKFGVDSREFEKNFDLPDDFDYVEDELP